MGIFYVYYLASPDDPKSPRYFGFQRCGEKRWREIYEHRDQLPENRLVRWFKELEQEPIEVPLIGKNLALDRPAAESICRFLIRDTNRLATGDPDKLADFLCNEKHLGGRHCRREIARIDSTGSVTKWESVFEAAKDLGVSRKSVWERLAGRTAGAVWV